MLVLEEKGNGLCPQAQCKLWRPETQESKKGNYRVYSEAGPIRRFAARYIGVGIRSQDWGGGALRHTKGLLGWWVSETLSSGPEFIVIASRVDQFQVLMLI